MGDGFRKLNSRAPRHYNRLQIIPPPPVLNSWGYVSPPPPIKNLVALYLVPFIPQVLHPQLQMEKFQIISYFPIPLWILDGNSRLRLGFNYDDELSSRS